MNQRWLPREIHQCVARQMKEDSRSSDRRSDHAPHREAKLVLAPERKLAPSAPESTGQAGTDRTQAETYAVGDNIEAAYDAGIDIKRHKIINFTVCSTLAAVAGVLLSMRLGTAEPNAGRIWELWTIIAVVLGGTRLTGGFGSMWMTLGGVLTLAVIRNGLRLLNTPNYVELMVMGTVLILALALDRLLAHRGDAG